MKFFGIMLLAGFFLAREQESKGANALGGCLREWSVCWFGSALISLTALLLPVSSELLPVMILLLAALLVVSSRASVAAMFFSALISFWILRMAPQKPLMAATWLFAGGATLTLSFFYLGLRERMLRLPILKSARGPAGRLLALFALAGLWVMLYQKIVQIF